MCTVQNNIYINAQILPQKPVKISVLLFSFDDPYISLVRRSLYFISTINDAMAIGAIKSFKYLLPVLL
jgi:hypothetical protein